MAKVKKICAFPQLVSIYPIMRYLFQLKIKHEYFFKISREDIWMSEKTSSENFEKKMISFL